MAFALIVLCALGCSASTVSAQADRTVVWLDDASAFLGHEDGQEAARVERERALRFVLYLRHLELLDGLAPQALTIDATAVMWLQSDPKRPVTWLCVRGRGAAAVAKLPLPSPSDAIDPELLAIAAGSLLDQVLSQARPKIVKLFGICPLPAATK